MTTNELKKATATFQVVNPANGEILETFPGSTDDQIETTLSVAEQAFSSWKELPVEDRARKILKAGKIFRENINRLAEAITSEMGKGLSEARAELNLCAGIFDYYGSQGPTLAAEQPISTPDGSTAIVEKLPLGPLLGIMPWNFPAYQLLRFAVPNLVIGNAVIIKPAASCPRSALIIEDILYEADIPAGIYSTILANHSQVADVIADPRIQGVSLTGSERAGAIVGELASRSLKKAVLELGGSDPYIILDTNSVQEAAETAWGARVSNMGQSCNSNKRMIVMDSIYDEFVAELARLATGLKPGDPFVEGKGTYNPMASATGAAEVAEQIREAVEKGATVHVGGSIHEGTRTYLAPTVLTGVTKDMRAYHEELFGPVAVVYKASDEDEAVDIANDSEYGLAGAVFSTDPNKASKIARRLNAGMTYVNVPAAYGAELPFGGIKRSGFGRELGPEGMDEFTNKRLFYINH